MSEMQKTSFKLCKSCRFAMRLNERSFACGYLEKAHARRNCPVGWCDKYEREKSKKAKEGNKKWLMKF